MRMQIARARARFGRRSIASGSRARYFRSSQVRTRGSTRFVRSFVRSARSRRRCGVSASAASASAFSSSRAGPAASQRLERPSEGRSVRNTFIGQSKGGDAIRRRNRGMGEKQNKTFSERTRLSPSKSRMHALASSARTSAPAFLNPSITPRRSRPSSSSTMPTMAAATTEGGHRVKLRSYNTLRRYTSALARVGSSRARGGRRSRARRSKSRGVEARARASGSKPRGARSETRDERTPGGRRKERRVRPRGTACTAPTRSYGDHRREGESP